MFPLKDISKLNYFLGIDMPSITIVVLISLNKYINGMIDLVGLSECKSIATHMVLRGVLSINDGTPLRVGYIV